MIDDKRAFSAQYLRARAPQTGQGNDETSAQMSQHTSSSVVGKHIGNINVATCHVKERDNDIASTSANDENPMRQNVHEEARKSRRAENVVYERGSQFRRSKPNLSKSLKRIFAVVVLLSIVSMAISSYLSYRMLIQPLDCNCTLRKAFGTSETKGIHIM